MVKHIQYGSIWQAIILMIVAFAGEYLIYEPNPLFRFDRAESHTIYPGRDKDWDGSELFLPWHKARTINKWELNETDAPMSKVNFDYIADELGCTGATYLHFPGGYSKHFTFFFNLFVLMQIVNMICSRKIHDEFNIFEGFFQNSVFLLVWGLILGLQIAIITWTSFIFKVIALSWEQWLIGLAISFTVFFVDFVTKFIPDRFTYAVGRDTVFDKREIEAGRPPESKFLNDED